MKRWQWSLFKFINQLGDDWKTWSDFFYFLWFIIRAFIFYFLRFYSSLLCLKIDENVWEWVNIFIDKKEHKTTTNAFGNRFVIDYLSSSANIHSNFVYFLIESFHIYCISDFLQSVVLYEHVKLMTVVSYHIL